MATTSSKNPSSCSTASSRPRKPNARNSEAIDPMRRSFSGSPFAKPSIIACQRGGGGGFNPNTPANSPSDFPQRKSISRESLIAALRDYEDKENGKDHNWKPARIHSPSTKNFMSLTTSAASKINASPRKKVLNERNDPVCTSVSVSDVKSPSIEDSGLKAEKGLNQKKEVSFDLSVTYLGATEAQKSDDDEALENNEDIGSFLDIRARDGTVLLSEHAIMEKDCVNFDQSFNSSPKAQCSLPSPTLAPLDADPSMPPYDDGDPSMLPYDPMTNYLSPRPQFLRYRPNPRIQLYLNKERNGVQLQESFVSLSSSDTEVTEDDSQSVGSQREFEDASILDVVKQQEEKAIVEEDQALPVSELNNTSTSEGVDLTEEKSVSKPHFFRRTKIRAFLPVLAVACLLVLLANSPVMDSSGINNLSCSTLYVPPEILEFTQKSLEGVGQQFRQQLNHLLSFADNLFASFRKPHKLGSLQYNNLSILLNDGLVDSDLAFYHRTLGSQEKYENYVSGPMKEGDGVDLVEVELQSKEAEEEVENYTEYEHQQVEEQSDIAVYVEDLEIVAEDNLKFLMEFGVSEPEEPDMDPEFKVIRPGNSAAEATEERIEAGDYNVELQRETYQEDQPNPILEPSETEQPPVEADVNHAEPGYSLAGEVPESSNLDAALRSPQNTQTGSLALNAVKDAFSAKFTVRMSFLALGLLAARAFICMKNQKIITRNAVSAVAQLPHHNKKINDGPMLVSAEHTFPDTKVDMVGESCPSEMSTFRTSEVQSGQRKLQKSSRRESSASSDYSMGSPSYGSFTTYEKISSKHGSKDEEVITPVRRSSRIRKQVTSP